MFCNAGRRSVAVALAALMAAMTVATLAGPAEPASAHHLPVSATFTADTDLDIGSGPLQGHRSAGTIALPLTFDATRTHVGMRHTESEIPWGLSSITVVAQTLRPGDFALAPDGSASIELPISVSLRQGAIELATMNVTVSSNPPGERMTAAGHVRLVGTSTLISNGFPLPSGGWPATLSLQGWLTPVPGPPPEDTTVPDLRELPRDIAGAEVVAAGLLPLYTDAIKARPAYVVHQTPAAGTVLDRGSTVTLQLKPGSAP
jgi:hypothetical protein